MNRKLPGLMGAALIVFCIVILGVVASASAQNNLADKLNDVVEVVDAYRSAREEAIITDFMALLAIPNVADQLPDMDRNVDHITALLEARGFTTQRLHAGGAPYIYAELMADSDSETVMIYAHFDGAAVLEEDWVYPPFSPALVDSSLQAGGQPVDISQTTEFDPEWRLYGRSAGDDKLPIIALIYRRSDEY